MLKYQADKRTLPTTNAPSGHALLTATCTVAGIHYSCPDWCIKLLPPFRHNYRHSCSTSLIKSLAVTDGLFIRRIYCLPVFTLICFLVGQYQFTGHVKIWYSVPNLFASHLGHILFLQGILCQRHSSMGKPWPAIRSLDIATCMSDRGPPRYSSRPKLVLNLRYHLRQVRWRPFLLSFHSSLYQLIL